MISELSYFFEKWSDIAAGSRRLMDALPPTAYDFRPDANGRSIGELAWHLAEIDGYTTLGIESGGFNAGIRPPHIERPRSIEALGPAYQIVHDEAVARAARFEPECLDRRMTYADGALWTVRDLLWGRLLMHASHHQGQLMLACRLVGGVPPPLQGRTRETTPARGPRS